MGSLGYHRLLGGDVVTVLFGSLVSYCVDRGLELVIGCNLNAHYEVWGNLGTNSKGRALVDYLSTTDLNVVNIGGGGNSPTFINVRRKEVLDITDVRYHLPEEFLLNRRQKSPHYRTIQRFVSACRDRPMVGHNES